MATPKATRDGARAARGLGALLLLLALQQLSATAQAAPPATAFAPAPLPLPLQRSSATPAQAAAPRASAAAPAATAVAPAAAAGPRNPFPLPADDPRCDYAGDGPARAAPDGANATAAPAATSTWAGANAFFLHTLPPRDRDRVLDAIQDAGFRVVRIFLQAHTAGLKNSTNLASPDVEPRAVGAYDPAQLLLVDGLMVACAARGLKLNIALHNRYSLGCWRADAYADKYRLPRAKDLLCNPPQQSDAAPFYASAAAAREIDRRFAFVLSHRNALMSNTAWSQLHEVVFGFDVQNESQAYLPDGVAEPSWVCGRARALRAAALHPKILVLTGGGALVADSSIPEHFACPWIDVVALQRRRLGGAPALRGPAGQAGGQAARRAVWRQRQGRRPRRRRRGLRVQGAGAEAAHRRDRGARLAVDGVAGELAQLGDRRGGLHGRCGRVGAAAVEGEGRRRRGRAGPQRRRRQRLFVARAGAVIFEFLNF